MKPTEPNGDRTWSNSAIGFLLGFITLIVYWRVHNFEFVNLDDNVLIYKNPMVTNGLTARGIYWGLTTSFYEYWHPLTWWSHMLDWQLFGANAGRQHLTSLAFHIANTLILFGALRQMTGKTTRSAVVAALFALHPMHMESVAWLAERKDVLSTFFWLLSIRAYASYVKALRISADRAESFYRLSAVMFLCGIASKPMVVTLPFVLLLLDYWPLNRFQRVMTAPETNPAGQGMKQFSATLLGLAREKIPFFTLTIVSCLITFSNVRTSGVILVGDVVPWSIRLLNVPVSYGRYLAKCFYPVNLAAFYPIPAHWPGWMVGVSVLALVVITALALRFYRTAPYVAVGWFIFLGILVPTLSLVPVGMQSIADRYTYMPYIGIFVALVWSVTELSAQWKLRVPILAGLTALSLFACGAVTWVQVGYWRNNLSLWPHCLAVTADNFLAENDYAAALEDANRPDEALPHHIKALSLRPNFFEANYNLGHAYIALGQYQNATNYFIKAIGIKSNFADAHASLGSAFFELGDYANTVKECGEAVRLNPADFYSTLYLARALSRENKFDDAVHYFSAALRIYPASAEANYYLGSEYLKHGWTEEAISVLNEALRLKPNYEEARKQLNLALAKRSTPKPPSSP